MRQISGRAWVLDGVLAAGFVVIAQVELHHQVDDGFQAGPMWLNVPLVLLMTAPLALRRVAPAAALAVMLAAAAIPGVFVAHTVFFWGSLVPMAVATYSVARHGSGAPARFAWLGGPVMLAANMLHMAELRTASNVFFGVGVFGVAWLVGWVLHRMADQSAALTEALTRLAEQQAAREAAAVADERRRIAAEMHDVVAHAVSLMTLQTGAARIGLEREGRPVPEQLRAAEQSGRRALTELRRALEVMRPPDVPAEGQPLHPLPGLDGTGALVEEFRRAGLDVHFELDVHDEVDEVPDSVQLTAYRILQEALTNVLKHAGPVAHASVATCERTLVVRVCNPPGRGATLPALPFSGHGLTGMRERIAIFGGELRLGPTPHGGFEVMARLPIVEREDAATPVGVAR